MLHCSQKTMDHSSTEDAWTRMDGKGSRYHLAGEKMTLTATLNSLSLQTADETASAWD